MDLKYKKLIVITSIILVVIGIFLGLLVFVFRVDTPAINYLRRMVHAPALVIGNTWISIAEVEDNTVSIKRFYENQDFSSYGIRMDFSTDDGKKRLKVKEKQMLNKIIEDVAIEQMAQDWNIALSEEAVQSAIDRPMAEMGTRENVESNLKNLYDWTLDDFSEKVVRGQLLKEKVATKYDQENKISESMQEKIAQAKKELDNGRDFADIAIQYSEGSTAKDGGVMGWFAYNQLQDEIGKQIFTMEKGTHSEIIETPIGLHIVRVNDVAEENNVKMVHISQIIVKKMSFSDFLTQYLQKMDVKVFLSQYQWDQESALIVFKDQELIDFEKRVDEEMKTSIQKSVELK